MANQFYYQIVDSTLYYGVNQWEGATLLIGNESDRWLFNLHDLGFGSIRPHDESIVEINLKKDYILF